MEKIGICACYDTKNYGSMLQALATQLKILDLGYDYELIRYRKKLNLDSIIRYLPRVLSKDYVHDYIKRHSMQKKIAAHPEVLKGILLRNSRFEEFMKRAFTKISPVYYGYFKLKRGGETYDGVLVGSDQLWTPVGLRSNFYNLMFVPDEVLKISYATSFGVSDLPKKYYKSARTFLNRIDYISVRELRGAEMVNELTGRKVKVVADPTLLLSKEEWETEIPVKKIIDGDYLFCYFLGANKQHREIANELKNQTGMKIVSIPHLDGFIEGDITFGDEQLYDVGPDDFVNLIRGANYICTDSFHGSIFSILHHKKFIIFNRFSAGANSRNSRINSLCEITGLSSRRYQGDISIIDNEIDYKAVDERLELLKEFSMSYLKDSLSALKKGKRLNNEFEKFEYYFKAK
jgi:hypothetical protein